ncbi:GAF domain-containing sensor histidine kinase [Leeuwenhoekiella sp.]|uniref:sensor histidine kinase n=1 Tax=Leeuwenhoekiella sp. TaxID=1977054 RepID=UPI0032428BB3
MNDKDFNRVSALAGLDLDYTALKSELNSYSILAAKVAGTELSEINLLDSYTQWTVASASGNDNQKPRESAVCNYTIKEENAFETRLDLDERFKNSPYVLKEGFKFYYGIPLKLKNSITLGSLCVAGKNLEHLDTTQVEQLHLIAQQIEQYLSLKHELNIVEEQLKQQHLITRRLAHDIRSPLSGIAQLKTEQDFKAMEREDLELYLSAAVASAAAMLTLTDDILSKDTASLNTNASAYVSLTELRTKLYELYTPQATPKNIELQIDCDATSVKIPRKNLLPLAGNLIANAIKFTPSGGKVSVALHILKDQDPTRLEIQVEDNGVGIAPQTIEALTSGTARAQTGTAGETGYGLGLRFVKELGERQGGTFTITSKEGLGTKVFLRLPID